MKWLIALYPKRWRLRYGEEFAALLEDQPLTLAGAVDMLRGALDAHLNPQLAEPALTSGGAVHMESGHNRIRLGALVLLLPSLLFLAWYGAFWSGLPMPAFNSYLAARQATGLGLPWWLEQSGRMGLVGPGLVLIAALVLRMRRVPLPRWLVGGAVVVALLVVLVAVGERVPLL